MEKNEFYYVHSFIYDIDSIEKKELNSIEFKDDFLVTFDKIFRDIEFNSTEYIPARKELKLDCREFVVTDLEKLYEIKIDKAEIYFFNDEIAFFVLKVVPLRDLGKEDLYYLNFMLSSFYKFEDDREIYVAPINGRKIGLNDCKNEFIKKDPDNTNFPFVDSKGEDNDFKKSRVGFLGEDEKEKIMKLLERECNEFHYMPVCKIIEKIKNEKILVNYDTFITGFFIDYVKINKSYNYYDNFNPLGVNFLFLYANFKLPQKELEKEYDDNFRSYEPFITYSKYTGFIKDSGFYQITQPDADIIIMGNQNNVLNFFNADSECIETIENYMEKHRNSSINKELIIYLYVLFQNVYLLMLSSMFVVDYNKEKELLNKFLRYKDNVSYIDKAIKKYNSFIINHNFNSVSDNPFLNSTYQFFRNLRQIPQKLSDLKLIVGQYNSLKNIIKNISKNVWTFLAAMLVLLIALKVLNVFSNYLIDGFINGMKYVLSGLFKLIKEYYKLGI